MIDKTDRKLLALLQQDCTLSLNELAEAVNLTSTPCWKELSSAKWRFWMVTNWA
jgi:Lrp/AsnC family transcriptional regulator